MAKRNWKSVLASVYYMFPVTFRESGRPCHQICHMSLRSALALSMKVGVADSNQQGASFTLVMVLMLSVLT